MKFRDVIKNKPYWHRLELIIEDGKNSWLRELGKNDFIHSQNIEKILDNLVPDDIKVNQQLFDPGEIYLLLASVYLHDIGRRKSTLHHEIESFNEIKKNYRIYNLSNRFEANAIAQICAAHASEDVWPISKCDNNYGIVELSETGKPFNLQKLGALLRIGDELENTYARVNGITSEANSIRHIIRFINPIIKKGIIELQTEPKSCEELEILNEIRDYTDKRLNEVTQYLRTIGLEYYQVWLNIGDFKPTLELEKISGNITDTIEDIALLVQLKAQNVDIFRKISNCEISIYCENTLFSNVKNKTGIFVLNEITKPIALELKGAINHLLKQKELHNSLIITTTQVSETILNILNVDSITVSTYDSFFRNFISFKLAFETLIKKYESHDIFTNNLFVDLNAYTDLNPNTFNLHSYISDWQHIKQSVHLTLLGEFGSGKTTYCEYLNYTLMKKYLEGDLISRIPILIKLKNFGNLSSIESAITDHFVNKLGLDLSYEIFDMLNKSGKLLIILDGFDELPLASSEKEIARLFRELDKLTTPYSKIILTCRTHYFKCEDEIHDVYKGSILYNSILDKYGYDLLYINQFDNNQICDYIRRNHPVNYEEIYAKINKTYNLLDLSNRPILLSIILKTLPQLTEINSIEINSSNLYRLYIRFWLDRDDWRSSLKAEFRLHLSFQIAEKLFIEDLQKINFRDIPVLLKSIKLQNKEYSIKEIDYDLRTCNFLKNTPSGNYSFVHISFQEYLLAESLLLKLLDKASKLSIKWFFPVENVNNKLIASIEAQDFFIKLLSSWLHSNSTINLYEKVKEDRRKIRLIAFCINEMSNTQYNIFFCQIINSSKHKLPLEYLITNLLKYTNLHETMKLLLVKLNHQKDKSKLLQIYAILVREDILELKPYLTKIKSLINSREETTTVDTKNTIIQYPFSKETKKWKLENFKANLKDSDNYIKNVAKFNTLWTQKKAEYDQALKLKKKNQQRYFQEFEREIRKLLMDY